MPYIQVIVPSPVYNSNLNTIHDITEPNARFSGIVSYYLLSGDPVSLTLYEQGKLLISLHCSNNLDTQTQKLNYILQKIPNPVFIRSPVETKSRGDYPPGYHFECPECGCTNCVHCLAMNPCQCACNGSNCSHIIPPIQVPVCAYCLCLLPCAGCQSCNLWSCSCGCHVNGGENPDGDHDKNICPICREYPCVCDSGGGSGLDNSRKHLAQRLFRNTSMIDATWAEIGRMLEEIINNCLGQKLFNDLENYLNGKKAIIKFNFNSSFSQFNVTNTEITLCDFDSSSLLHELLHLYQAYQYADETTYMNNQLNHELEAYYIQYLYNKGRTDSYGSLWKNAYVENNYLRRIVLLDRVLTPKGELKPGATYDQLKYVVNEALSILRKVGYGSYYIHNPNKQGLANFENLRALSKNCP